MLQLAYNSHREAGFSLTSFVDAVYVETMSDSWIEVYITYDTIEAQILKDLLESGDVPVVVRSSKVTPYPVNLGKMGEIKILVRKEDEEAAKKLIGQKHDA